MSTNNKQKNKEYIILSIVIIIAFLLRIYKINAPLADWHSWRQADTSAVTRRYVKEGTDLLLPRYDDLSSIPSGLDNPQGYRLVEFPLINAITAQFFRQFPQLTLEVWGRLTSILFSLGSILLVFFLVNLYLGVNLGLLSAAVYAFLPFNLYYQRTILPENGLVFFSLFSLYFFSRWVKAGNSEKSRIYFLLSLLAAAISLLIKPVFAFLFIPLFYLCFNQWGLSTCKKKNLYLFIILAILPLIFWRLWITHYPEGIPAFTWLLNGSKIRFRPAFFRWLFAERIAKLVFGCWGLIPFGIGLLKKPTGKSKWFFHWWLVSALLYLFVFATGNVTHDYYQIFIIPPLSIFTGIGLEFLLNPPQQFVKSISRVLALVCILFNLGFSWFLIRDFYNINHPEIVIAGQAAAAILPENAKVIAPYGGDTAFLYQINRQGWPVGGEIKNKIEKGATDYVTVNLDEEARYLLEHCQPSINLDEFTIINLRSCSL